MKVTKLAAWAVRADNGNDFLAGAVLEGWYAKHDGRRPLGHGEVLKAIATQSRVLIFLQK